jgi:hypothetical protein
MQVIDDEGKRGASSQRQDARSGICLYVYDWDESKAGGAGAVQSKSIRQSEIYRIVRYPAIGRLLPPKVEDQRDQMTAAHVTPRLTYTRRHHRHSSHLVLV